MIAPQKRDATPGEWTFEPGDSGDDSVGMAPTPPSVYSAVDDTGNVVPICILDEPERHAARDPVDEYDECRERFGTIEGNAALICAAPALLAALSELLAALDHSAQAVDDDVAAMIRYGEAERGARNAIAKAAQ